MSKTCALLIKINASMMDWEEQLVIVEGIPWPFENDNFWSISDQLGKFGKDSKSSFTQVLE